MFGSVRHVFASRWKALWWACGVLVTAYCSVPSPDSVSDGGHGNAEKHVNPWAKGYEAQAVHHSDGGDLNAMMKKIKEEQRQLQQADQPHENPWAKKPDGQKS